MTAWNPQANEIFLAAIELQSVSERDAFLDLRCHGDCALRDEVSQLMHAHGIAGSFLDVPSASDIKTIVTLLPPDALGTRIGPYKLREVLGEGGMGTVFIAEQERPVRRKVALKLIKLGMDTRDVLARFEAERQALALMDHPNIARVLDAGMTEGGRPYFVMEVVKGLPITEHCDVHKVPTRERLQLFLQVCRAIQHAHQKGIIHRDLKPSNILVAIHDTIPVVKVIDFGVAKAIGQPLTERTIYTAFSQMVGTPLYMSPEQAGKSSLDVDTRSDIYSMGVLLYELLTGGTPFAKEMLKQVGFDELRRIILDVDPPRPSTRFSTLDLAVMSTIAQCRNCKPRQLRQLLHGELDWVVMKALEKDRTRRYESASALAADIEHYLHNEPVEACPPSTLYRVRKYALRHKGLLTAMLAVTIAVLIGTSFSVWLAIEATNARKLADERLILANERLKREREARADAGRHQANATANLGQALDAVDQMLTRVADVHLAATPGAEKIRQDLFRDAIRFYEAFFKQAPNDPRLRLSIATAWSRYGTLHETIGNYPEAQVARQEAIKAFEALHAESPDNAVIQDALANVVAEFGGCEQWNLNNLASAEQAYERAVSLWKDLLSRSLDNVEYQWRQTSTQVNLADLYRATNRLDQAEQTLRNAVKVQRTLWGRGQDSLKRKSALCYSLSQLAYLLAVKADHDVETERLCSEAVQRGEEILANDPDSIPALLGLVHALTLSGDFLKDHKRLHEAESRFGEAVEAAASLTRLSPHSVVYRVFSARAHVSLGRLLSRGGRQSQALTSYRSAIDLLQPALLIPKPHSNWNDYYRQALDGFFTSFERLVRTEHDAEARRLCEELSGMNGTGPGVLLTRLLAARAWEVIGETARAEKLLADAISSAQRDDLKGDDRIQMSRAVFSFADAEFRRPDYKAALPLLDLTLRWNPENSEALDHRGQIRLQAGQHEAAIADFDESLRCGAAYGSSTLRYRALAHFRMERYSLCLEDLAQALAQQPGNMRNLTAIDPAEIAACPNEEFRKNYLAWFEQAFQSARGVAEARVCNAALLAELGRTTAADEQLALLVADESGFSEKWTRGAIAALRIGNESRYREFCSLLAKRSPEALDLASCRNISWSCVIAANAVDDYELPIAVAKQALTLSPDSCGPLVTLGGILFRAGKLDEAKTHLSAGLIASDIDEKETAYGLLLLAMTNQRLNDVAEAQSALTKGTAAADRLLDRNLPPHKRARWDRRVALQHLRDEAQSLIKPGGEPSIPSPAESHP